MVPATSAAKTQISKEASRPAMLERVEDICNQWISNQGIVNRDQSEFAIIETPTSYSRVFNRTHARNFKGSHKATYKQTSETTLRVLFQEKALDSLFGRFGGLQIR